MNQDGSLIKNLIQKMISWLNEKGDSNCTETERLVIRLNGQFPNDIGIFSAFLLNYFTLQPGQGLFLAANEPHAYLSGKALPILFVT